MRAAIRQALPDTRFYITVGLTEAGPRVATLALEHGSSQVDCVGMPIGEVEVRVFGLDGKPCPPGAPGALEVRTQSRMSGYLGEPGDLSMLEWHATGDLATVDERGLLYVHGRMSGEFKYRDQLFNPTIVERWLVTHSAVSGAEVAPVRGKGGEFLRAVVYCPSAPPPDLQRELLARCKANLPSAFVPQEFVFMPERKSVAREADIDPKRR